MYPRKKLNNLQGYMPKNSDLRELQKLTNLQVQKIKRHSRIDIDYNFSHSEVFNPDKSYVTRMRRVLNGIFFNMSIEEMIHPIH